MISKYDETQAEHRTHVVRFISARSVYRPPSVIEFFSQANPSIKGSQSL